MSAVGFRRARHLAPPVTAVRRPVVSAPWHVTVLAVARARTAPLLALAGLAAPALMWLGLAGIWAAAGSGLPLLALAGWVAGLAVFFLGCGALVVLGMCAWDATLVARAAYMAAREACR